MEHRGHIFRFADVEVREGEFSVLKDGEVLPVEPKVYKVLEFLLRNRGRVVSKNELLDAVWSDVEVSESSLTRTIAVLRRLLGDDVHEQRFIATVATVGYRFVAAVAVVEEGAVEVAEAPPTPSEPGEPAAVPAPVRAARPRPRWLWWAAAGAAVVLVLIALALWRRPPGQPVVDGVTQLTDDGNPKLYNPLFSDGPRIYFDELQGVTVVVAQVAATGGQTGVITTGQIIDLASDSSSLLLWSERLKLFSCRSPLESLRGSLDSTGHGGLGLLRKGSFTGRSEDPCIGAIRMEATRARSPIFQDGSVGGLSLLTERGFVSQSGKERTGNRYGR